MRLCPETFPVIMAHEPVASNAIVDGSKAISLKNAAGVLILVTEWTAGADTDLVLTVHEGATAAGAVAGSTPITTDAEFPIWVNADCATSDVMVRQTDAITYTIDATAATIYLVAFYIPAAILTEGYPWVSLGTSGGNASNLVSVVYILDGARYQQETPPTAIE